MEFGKEKAFHLIRQVYGQKVSSQLRYGIIHIYEVWWFCCRDEEGNLRISSPVMKEATSPSVLQSIKAMAGFDDLFLEDVTIHPGSATKAANPRLENRKRKRGDVGESPGRVRIKVAKHRGRAVVGHPTHVRYGPLLVVPTLKNSLLRSSCGTSNFYIALPTPRSS